LRQLPAKFAPGLRFILSPRWPGGEGSPRAKVWWDGSDEPPAAWRGGLPGRGTDEPVRGAAHLTLPSPRDGSLPLPPEGRRGAPRFRGNDGITD
jgi:hypothetical protein